MFGLTGTLQSIAAAGLAAIATFGVMSVIDAVWDDPAIRRETRLIVQAEAERNFNKATEELSDDADKARLRRAHCHAGGGVYDFATGECAQGQD